MKIVTGLLLLFMIVGNVSGGRRAKTARLDEPFSLKVGGEAMINGESLRVSFASLVSDSRCPIGVTCIWRGTGVISVKLSKGNAEAATMELRTDMEPREKSYDQYSVKLVALEPYPQKDSSAEPKDYVATIVVHKNAN